MSDGTVLVIDDSPTILKVVQLVLTKAGYDVHTASDGESGLAAAGDVRPDLILLDFVMPKMNGYQVCRTLSTDESLSAIPVVLMSAKGDQVGERFVKVMGIVDYITKPFSPEALTAVVQHSISKFAHRSEAGESRRLLVVENADGEATDPEPTEDSAEPVTSPDASGLAQFRSELAALLAAKLSTEQASTATALDDDTLAQIARMATSAERASNKSSLSGELRTVPIAEVLQLLDAQKQTGVLSVRRENATVELWFRQGRVEFVSGDNVQHEFRLGRFIVDYDLMTQQDLDGFLESRPAGSKLIGSQLVKLGYLSDNELRSALRKQACELIYEILRWNFGDFDFSRQRRLDANAREAKLGLEVESVLMEGFRRVDEWHLIEREVHDFDMVFLRNEDAVAQMGRGRLTREELAVLELVNGKHTVKEIIRSSKLGSFEVSKMLYRLLSIKLIRRRVQPIAV